MHETHGCAPTRKTWGAIGVCGPWEVRTKSPFCDAIVTWFSRFSVCSCDFWPSIAWTRTCTPRVSEGVSSDAVRARADAVRALKQPTASLADQYGANTGPVEPTCMGVFWPTHVSLRAQSRWKPISESCTCSSFSHELYDPVRVQKTFKKSYTPTARSSAQSDHGFRIYA